MQSKLQKAINLVKKTGDRIIVFDSAKTSNPYVVMDLNEYEKLIIGRSEVRGLTEDELLDKINRDIAIWKSEQEIENLSPIAPVRESYFEPLIEGMEDNIESKDRIEGMEDNIESKDKQVIKKHWAIPTERKEGAEEIIEEDRQYLEEVRF